MRTARLFMTSTILCLGAFRHEVLAQALQSYTPLSGAESEYYLNQKFPLCARI
jgi:hypothetical protein